MAQLLPKRLRQARAEYRRKQTAREHSDCEKIIKESGPHFGLYCQEHGTWLKWMSGKELVSNGIFTEEQLEDHREIKRLQNLDWDTSPWK